MHTYIRHVTWNVILLEKLIVPQLVKFPVFNTIIRLIIVFTRVSIRHVGLIHPQFLKTLLLLFLFNFVLEAVKPVSTSHA
jgi:hypothetical protein